MQTFTSRLALRGLVAVFALGVCPAQQQPSPQGFGPGDQKPLNIAAKVLQLEGRVSVLKDSSPWALNIGDTVSPKQIILTGPDGQALFEVNDGSTFWIFPNSKVTFRGTYTYEELLNVWLGKIKVHIQRWGGQPNNSRVETPTAVISVRGTTFDVEVDPADDSTLVAVEEGAVAVRHRLLPTAEPRELRTGDQLRVYKNVPIAKAKLDKGNAMRKSANALAEIYYSIMMRGPRLGGGSGGGAPVPGGGGVPAPLPGDTDGGAGAPPPPPPPPPPPASAPPPPPGA